jgi:ArsR family transcriptional regulator
MSLVLHHLASPFSGIIEANRILKTGDTLLIIDLAKHNDEFLRKKYGDRWLGFESSGIGRWLNDAGFGVREKKRFELNKGLKADLFVAVKRKDVSRQVIQARTA